MGKEGSTLVVGIGIARWLRLPIIAHQLECYWESKAQAVQRTEPLSTELHSTEDKHTHTERQNKGRAERIREEEDRGREEHWREDRNKSCQVQQENIEVEQRDSPGCLFLRRRVKRGLRED
ncbi:hypothetical protein CgunFtcFv8_013443 [Champsocephalus gunnari]|uniref:Uncharacterized protein n=1 Tax=Champsocephalus gunnari TaxID=52237 RepID=A0AAN8DS95_CHAGU|nr:hypothetical protein CgunFtcFv8_013443 [Champsocephalus gunnari]